MKCFYHEKKDAVGQCKNCGKGLCKECMVEHDGFCEDCYFDNKANDIDNTHAEIQISLTEYRSSIIKSLIIGGIGFVVMLFFLLGIVKMPIDSFGMFIETIVFGFIPLGYTTLSKVFGKDPNMGAKNTAAFLAWSSGIGGVSEYGLGWLIGRFLAFCVKVVISFFIGIPALVYLIIKLLKTNKELDQLEKDYKDVVDNYVDEMKNSDKLSKK